jgi:hypothetical protein
MKSPMHDIKNSNTLNIEPLDTKKSKIYETEAENWNILNREVLNILKSK